MIALRSCPKKLIAAETEKWVKVIRHAGIKAD